MKRFSIATVSEVSHITPNMIRVTLLADMIKAFPAYCAGGHVKLVIPPINQDIKQFQKFLGGFNIRNQMRTYTIRHINMQSGEIDIDFVAHGDSGPASAWAMTAKRGDFIGISPPGGPKLKVSSSNQYLIAVDMTAFPAAAASVEKLPKDAQGDFYTEILSPDDIQPINAPSGIKLHWVLKDPSGANPSLIETVKALKLRGDESVFVAGEYTPIGELRTYFRSEKAYPKDQLYISSYWKQGLIESEHKRVKTLVA